MNGHILRLHRCGTDVRFWHGQSISLLPPADTWHHWRDLCTAIVWVPNWNSDFWWAEVALAFNHAGALVQLQIRMSNMMIGLFVQHQNTNYHWNGQKMKPLGVLLYRHEKHSISVFEELFCLILTFRPLQWHLGDTWLAGELRSFTDIANRKRGKDIPSRF